MKIGKIILASLAVALSQTALALAPLDAVRDPKNRIKDSAGRVLHLIDLRDDALTGYSDDVSPVFRERFHIRHSGKAVNLALALEQLYGFQSVDMTSRIGLSIGAYLTPAQLLAIRNNSLVTLVSEAAPWEFSATTNPPWAERNVTLPSGLVETYPWGRAAVGGIAKGAQTGPYVYLVDGGVGRHADLNVVGRLATRMFQSDTGCYAHATHVAGIVGASFQNGGVAGVVAGLPIVSVQVLTHYGYDASGWSICMRYPNFPAETLDTLAIAQAYDIIRSDMDSRSPGKAAIINMSINIVDTEGTTIYSKMANMAASNISASPAYGGAFITQSAGNRFINACQRAYNPASSGLASTADGIMVVGGVNGQCPGTC